MRALAAVFLLSACASNGNGHYLLVTETAHGPVIWNRFETRDICEQASEGGGTPWRCMTRQEFRAARRVGR